MAEKVKLNRKIRMALFIRKEQLLNNVYHCSEFSQQKQIQRLFEKLLENDAII
ncbi:hypothetical protein MASR1M74_30710 [Lentimicrobium sp.]